MGIVKKKKVMKFKLSNALVESYDVRELATLLKEVEVELTDFSKSVRKKKRFAQEDGAKLLEIGLKAGFLQGRICEIEKINKGSDEQPDYIG